LYNEYPNQEKTLSALACFSTTGILVSLGQLLRIAELRSLQTGCSFWLGSRQCQSTANR